MEGCCKKIWWTVVSGVLKAKYYPRCDFLNAPLGHSSSLSWRSIWSAQLIVKEGCRWRVGNEEQVHVLGDSWLRGDDHMPLKTLPASPENQDIKMRDLFIQGSRCWNTTLMNLIMNPNDVDRILRVPILPQDNKNKRIWRWSKGGVFSVRTTYHRARLWLVWNI